MLLKIKLDLKYLNAASGSNKTYNIITTVLIQLSYYYYTLLQHLSQINIISILGVYKPLILFTIMQVMMFRPFQYSHSTLNPYICLNIDSLYEFFKRQLLEHIGKCDIILIMKCRLNMYRGEYRRGTFQYISPGMST